jgi:acetyl esterase
MPLLPALQAVLDAMADAPAAPPSATPAEARASAHAMMDTSFMALAAEHPPVASEADHTVPVDGGEITVRAYTPDVTPPLPCHVYIHGGGWWLGTLEHSDNTCRAIAADAECVVASVDDRLAPESTFPTAAEDCYAALAWVVEHAYELGVDPARISVGGGSAGGNLSAVVALMARDRGGPALVFQVLEIPVTDATMGQPSIVANDGYLLTRAGMEQYRDYYLPNDADWTHPYASPLHAPDLSGLPPALVMTAEYDPLRDEGEAYAARLAEAGVEVDAMCWEGQFHGSQSMAKLIPDEAAAYHREVVNALKQAYGTA